MLPKITPDGRHVVYYPPTVIKGIEGNFFAVSGQVWIEVPENTTLEEANKLFAGEKKPVSIGTLHTQRNL